MLIPDTIKFSYVPRTQIQIHENSNAATQRGTVDFSLPLTGQSEEDEHVLVLEFMDDFKKKRSTNIGHALSLDKVSC